MTRLLAALIITLCLSACGEDKTTTAPTAPTVGVSSCPNGPYTFDANPNVQRCRAFNGEFAASACCGR